MEPVSGPVWLEIAPVIIIKIGQVILIEVRKTISKIQTHGGLKWGKWRTMNRLRGGNTAGEVVRHAPSQ